MNNKLFILFISLFGCIHSTFAYDCIIDGVAYNRISNTDFEVTYKNGYSNDYSGDITIPQTIIYKGKTFTVTKIGEQSFEGNTIKSITLPNSIKVIGSDAFCDCKINSNKITIPSSVKEMELRAFAFLKVKEVHINDLQSWCLIKMGNMASPLYGNSADLYLNGKTIVDLVIPNGIKSIGAFSFSHTNIKTLSIPISVDSIANGAFYGCDSLESVTIPNSVKYIGIECFSQCNSLEKAVFPNNKSITIRNQAFSYCRSLKYITLSPCLTEIETALFSGCSSLETITIPDNVEKIGAGAFKYCYNLSKIVLPEKLVRIGGDAFGYDEKIETIIIKAINPPVIEYHLNRTFDSSITPFASLYVPKSSIELYRNAPGWNEFYDIYDIATSPEMETTDVQHLTIEVRGKPIIFALLEKPVITYQNNLLVVATSKETVEIPVGDISSIVFSGTSTAIHNLMSEGKPQVKGGLAYFSDLKPGTLVYVFTSDGKNIAKVKADYNGTAQVSLSDFPKGVYLLKAGKQTIKIINK